MRHLCLLLSLVSAFPGVALSAHAATHTAAPKHWVGTWATSPIAVPNKTNEFATDTTLRQTVHVSMGGTELRLVLSNELGTEPLTIGGAQVALPTTAVPVTFSGQPGIVIPPGAEVYSDPVALNLPALADLSISLFIPAQKIPVLSEHTFADTTNYQAAGNQLTAATLTEPTKDGSWCFLKAVEVDAPAETAAIVAFGDSITDGAGSLRDGNHRWPDVLAERLQSDKKTASFGVLNEGIGGNRVLHDGTGPSALARFDRDVIAQAGVRYVIVLEGINDIGHLTRNPTPADPAVTAAQLIAGLQQLIDHAHAHGIRIIGATLTPYTGAGYASPEGETIRQAVNAFIRTPGNFDGVVDFEAATKDPANPGAYLPAYDHGDHLHPSDAGYKAMGDAIDLKLFSK